MSPLSEWSYAPPAEISELPKKYLKIVRLSIGNFTPDLKGR